MVTEDTVAQLYRSGLAGGTRDGSASLTAGAGNGDIQILT
jgi:hypothetical protein